MGETQLRTLRNRMATESGPRLRDEIEAAVQARRAERTGHTEWGSLCEEAGLFHLAFTEFQLALRDRPDDPVAVFRLAHHYRERGDTKRAAELLERLFQADPKHGEGLALYAQVLHEEGALPRLRTALRRAVCAGLPPEKARALEHGPTPAEEVPSEEAELAPTDADCIRFQQLFAGREDVHARQWSHPTGEGGYSPVREAFSPAVVRNHLLGTYTVGVYPLRLDGTCTFFALDLDIDKAALLKAQGQPSLAHRLRQDLRREGLRLLGVLRGLGFAPLFEDSGYKGRHFWVFLERPEPADVLYLLGRYLLAWQAPLLPEGLHLEFFPKQAERKGKGLGNLIKLPLGIHRRTGRRAVLLDDRGQPRADMLGALRGVVRATREALYAASDQLKALAGSALPPAPAESAPGPPDSAARNAGPAPPAPAPAWTEADFETDPRLHHLLERCPVLRALKRTVDEHRRLSHEEQLVLIHTLGHVEGGPQAVNYLLGKCVDVGPEKFLKDRLKGNPVSCPSIRKKIGHVTRRVACNCAFDFAPDRYPTPGLHLLTLPDAPAAPVAAAPVDLEGLARRYGVIEQRRREVEKEHTELRLSLVTALRHAPNQCVCCPGGHYRLVETDGAAELRWEPAPGTTAGEVPPAGEHDAHPGDQ